MTQARITKSSPTDSPRTLGFFRDKKFIQKFEIGFTPSRARALNESGVGKFAIFQPISHRMAETVRDRTKVTIND